MSDKKAAALAAILNAEKTNSTVASGEIGEPVTAEKIFSLVTENFKEQTAAAIVWLNNTVIAGHSRNLAAGLDGWQWSNGQTPDFSQLVEMRIFNETAELYIAPPAWRYRRDGDGEDIEYVEAAARLWGERKAVENGFIKLKDEARKIELIVPMLPKLADSDYYELVTRSYIGYAASGQAGYIDSRFVKITERREK